MSLVNNSYSATQNVNFGVRTQFPVIPSNRSAPLVTGRITKQDMGPAGTSIPPGAILGNTIVVSPTGANQTYTLPTASSILSEFGKSIDTGVPKLSVGDSHIIRIVNRGTAPAYVASNPTGGDGTAIIVNNGGATGNYTSSYAYTGTVVPVGHLTSIYLEWLQVNGGVQGATGFYTIYA